MFETVAPPAATSRSRSALLEALTFSLFVHAGAGAFMLVSTLWEVKFPNQSPALNITFVLEAPAPPPPPPPPRPKLIEPAQKVATTPVKTAPELFVAPAVIPETIPVVQPEALTPVAMAVPNGVIGGSAEGADNGQLGGTIGGGNGVVGSVAAPPPDDGRVHFSRDKKLPLITVSQDYPSYPETAQKHGWEDELVVRYVIGKDGRVKDVKVVEPPTRDLFIRGTLDAIRGWRFRPLVKDGKRQEVVHELTIYYRLTSHAT